MIAMDESSTDTNMIYTNTLPNFKFIYLLLLLLFSSGVRIRFLANESDL
jgi:hypothetical protein